MQTLKEMPIWVVWKYETINGKRTKVLYSVRTKNKCGTNEKYKSQWVLFEEASAVAINADFDGVGFVIPKGYAVIDMDHIADENVPRQIGALIPSYMEISPSGEGMHIVAKVDIAAIPTECGKLSPSYYMKNPHNNLELYIGGLTNRYMTFTGNAVKDVAVIGLPDKRLGEIAAAIIEIKQGFDCTEDQIEKFCLK